MAKLLRRFGRLVSARPAATLVVLAVVTAGVAGFALRLERTTGAERYAPGSAAGRALDRVTSEFGGGGGRLQVLIDAGEGGNVLTPEGLELTDRLARAVTAAAREDLADPDRPLTSYATVVRAALAQAGVEGEPTPEEIGTAVRALAQQASGELAPLLSSDFDPSAGTARAGLGLVALAADVGTDAEGPVALDVRDAVRGVAADGFDVAVTGAPLVSQAASDVTSQELPRLLGISMLLLVVILSLLYRRPGDVVVSVVGLVVTLAWTYGIGALLGPGWLGLTGPFNEITTIVPILVVGLGVDYAIHLVSRQREARADAPPARAAAVAVGTVGVALVLTTVTTAIGFLTNLASPFPPVRDFGVFTAVGVASAFIVMATLVPASRTLLDRRRARRHPDEATGEGRTPLAVVGRTARLTTTHPRAVLATAGALSVAAVIAGLQVPTSFTQEAFIPEDADVARTLDRVESLFGADVSERTYVLVSGPTNEPAAARAVARAPELLAGVDGVRTAGGAPVVDSPATLLAELARTTGDPAELRELGWEGSTYAPDADVAALHGRARELAPQRAEAVLGAPDDATVAITIGTDAGQSGAEQLVDGVAAALAPLQEAGLELTVTSQPLVFARTVEALTSSQVRSILITLGAAAAVLVGFFWVSRRRPALGLVAMLPTALVVTWVLGTMWLIGLSFDVLTVTIASLALAIGVDYGIHITYRFEEEKAGEGDLDDAITRTVARTGGALAGSAATTAAAFGVLIFSSLTPISRFGIVTALTITYSVVAAVIVTPAALRLWAGWHEGRDEPDLSERHDERASVPAAGQ